jgi:hypothetical protein
MPTMSAFRDPDFQRKLVQFLCRDRNLLREVAYLLEPDDFKPRKNESTDLWTISTAALEFWRKYREPIGGMLRPEMLDYARKMNFSDRERTRLLESVAVIQSTKGLVAVEALIEKVLTYKRDRLKAAAVDQLLDLKERGELTDEKWLQVCMDGVQRFGSNTYQAVDYFKGLEDRIERRHMARRRKHPFLMIDPLDERIRAIGRGHLGLWLAYLKMGKSLGLIHTALSYMVQGMNVLYYTLEDPMVDTEDRFDANITALPTKRLVELPKTLRIRYARFTRLLRSKLKIVDGTDSELTVAKIDEIWERERNRGFTADAVLVDYDDEIKPPRKNSERRFELADIYRDLRRFAARRDIIVWTAAQTGRATEGKKIITSGTVAEDISKLRKVMLAIGIGQGDWGENSRYLFVAAHKFDRQRVGCHIVSDPDRAIFYDRSATLRRMAIEEAKNVDQEE